MKKRIILIGGGGHCRSTIDVIESTDHFEISGILEISEKKGTCISGYPVVGSDEKISEFVEKEYAFCITVGQIKSSKIRQRIFRQLEDLNADIPVIRSGRSVVSEKASLGAGTVVYHNAVVNAWSSIGKGCIINTGSIIEHDVSVGCFCHISTGACINGDVKIGDNVFIGSNAVLGNDITICSDVIIGAGSVVLSSIEHPGCYAGNPVRRIK